MDAKNVEFKSLRKMTSIEYVPRVDTIADIALSDTASGSLRTTTSILLGLLVIMSFILNLLLISTILSSSKLRSVVLYLLFCNVALLNVVDILAGMFVSLLFVANGSWFFSEALCRFNAAIQQFIRMELLMGLMIMAVERAINLFFPHRSTFTHARTIGIIATLWAISICFAIPVLTPSVPVKPFKFRYLCAVDSNGPILFPLARILVHGGCLFISLVCFGAVLSRRNQDKAKSLPAKPEEFSDFIKKSRALQENLKLAKLVLFLMVSFIFIEGPNIILSLFVEIRNSREILKYNNPFEVPQDADTILNWLKFIYPLTAPLIIYSVCSDIWLKLQQLFCCHRPKTITIGKWKDEHGNNGGTFGEGNVMTLIATSEGLQLRLPHHASMQHTPNLIHAGDVRRDNSLNYQHYGELAGADPKPIWTSPSSNFDPQLAKVSKRDRNHHETHPSKIPRIKGAQTTSRAKFSEVSSKKSYRTDEKHGHY